MNNEQTKQIKQKLQTTIIKNPAYVDMLDMIKDNGIDISEVDFNFEYNKGNKQIQIQMLNQYILTNTFQKKYNVSNVEYNNIKDGIEISNLQSATLQNPIELIKGNRKIQRLEDDLWKEDVLVDFKSNIDYNNARKSSSIEAVFKLQKYNLIKRLTGIKDFEYRFKNYTLQINNIQFTDNDKNTNKSFEDKYSYDFNELRKLGLKLISSKGNNPKFIFTELFKEKNEIVDTRDDFYYGFDNTFTNKDFIFEEENGKSVTKILAQIEDKCQTLKYKINKDKEKEDEKVDNKNLEKELNNKVETINELLKELKKVLETEIVRTYPTNEIKRIEKEINENIAEFINQRRSLIVDINQWLEEIFFNKTKERKKKIINFLRSSSFVKQKEKSINNSFNLIEDQIIDDKKNLQRKIKNGFIEGLRNNSIKPGHFRKIRITNTKVKSELADLEVLINALKIGTIEEIIDEVFTDLFIEEAFDLEDFNEENLQTVKISDKRLTFGTLKRINSKIKSDYDLRINY